jgi:hypothetical protein
MRVPVLSTDLPEKFNKVAKYIGRHWPHEKMGLNKSRETLAYLLGYNSAHEVNEVANSNTLPDTISLDKVYSRMVGKALYKYGVRPDTFNTVLYKTPFKELAFYAVTDVEQERIRLEKLRESSGMMIFHDEYQNYINYKSPSLIVEQHKKSLLPPYQYAVNKNGEIFCSGTYESLLNNLGKIEDLVSDIDVDISVFKFIDDYIFPLAWLPINEFLDNTHSKERANWKAPYMVKIKHLRQDGTILGYALFHSGYNAYYPVVCKSIEAVNGVLAKLYKGELVSPDNNLIDIFETAMSLRPEVSSSEYWSEQDFKNAEHINIDGQRLIRPDKFKPYTQLVTNEILNSSLWNPPKKVKIHKNAIDAKVYSDHISIKQTRDQTLESAVQVLEHVKKEDIRKVVKFVFGIDKVSLKTLINYEYDEEYKVDEADLSKWTSVGTEALKLYPEMDGIIDNPAMGYLYCNYENYVKGDRYAWHCEKRDIAFIGYTLSNSSMVKGSRVQCEDDVLTGTLLLAAYNDSCVNYDLDKFADNYADIITMLTLHYKQKDYISNMEKYASHLTNCNPIYLSHGDKAHYSEKSSREFMQEATMLGRKTNVNTFTVEQNIPDFK